MSIDLLSTIFGLILTLMVFSYLLDDNPLFRVAVYIFIGVSAGYAATVVCYQVLSPKLLAPLRTGDPNQLLLTVIPLFLSISLLAKLTPRISWIGNFAMAVLVGVGAAAALGGAVLGTLIPQVQAAMDAFDFRSAATTSDAFFGLLNGIVMLVGTVFTLGYFHFSAERAADAGGIVCRSVYVGSDRHDRTTGFCHKFLQTVHWYLTYACIAGPKRIHISH